MHALDSSRMYTGWLSSSTERQTERWWLSSAQRTAFACSVKKCSCPCKQRRLFWRPGFHEENMHHGRSNPSPISTQYEVIYSSTFSKHFLSYQGISWLETRKLKPLLKSTHKETRRHLGQGHLAGYALTLQALVRTLRWMRTDKGIEPMRFHSSGIIQAS